VFLQFDRGYAVSRCKIVFSRHKAGLFGGYQPVSGFDAEAEVYGKEHFF
jgi:hypothetical protein